jgi:hypothetical protein
LHVLESPQQKLITGVEIGQNLLLRKLPKVLGSGKTCKILKLLVPCCSINCFNKFDKLISGPVGLKNMVDFLAGEGGQRRNVLVIRNRVDLKVIYKLAHFGV